MAPRHQFFPTFVLKNFFPLQPDIDFSQNDKCLLHIKVDMGKKKRAQDRSGNVMAKPEKADFKR